MPKFGSGFQRAAAGSRRGAVKAPPKADESVAEPMHSGLNGQKSIGQHTFPRVDRSENMKPALNQSYFGDQTSSGYLFSQHNMPGQRSEAKEMLRKLAFGNRKKDSNKAVLRM